MRAFVRSFQLPMNASLIEIDTPVLLDTTTERLGGVVVKDGGRLVFQDGAGPRLITEYLLIEDGGEVRSLVVSYGDGRGCKVRAFLGLDRSRRRRVQIPGRGRNSSYW